MSDHTSPLGLSEIERIAQDEVEKLTCLEGGDAREFGAGVVEGYLLGAEDAIRVIDPDGRIGMPAWDEAKVRDTIRRAVSAGHARQEAEG